MVNILNSLLSWDNITSVCLRLYVVPGLEGGLREGDEGWLGAWWLGFVVVSSLTALIAPLLSLFPQRLPSNGETTDAKLLGELTLNKHMS